MEQFHTPSFGDEVVFEVDANCAGEGRHSGSVIVQTIQPQQGQPTEMSKRRSTDICFEELDMSSQDPKKNVQSTNGAVAIKVANSTISDTGEPQKPISAFGCFFRDTVTAIKQQNPASKFQDLQRVVTSMWEELDPDQKNLYIKRSETARMEYMKQLRAYKLRQHQKTESTSNSESGSNMHYAQSNSIMQSKPAVFMIPRSTAEANADENQSNATLGNQFTNTNAIKTEHVVPQVNVYMPPQQHFVTSTSDSASTAETATSADPTDTVSEQIQMLTEAGSVQMCTREVCNKRAIINPDWEDEYCSNECVVVHCRSVFNDWVKALREEGV